MKRTDTVLLLLNLFLLLVIVFYSFPTALLAQSILTSSGRLAALVYSGTSIVLAIFFNLLWRYAVKGRLLDKKANPSAIKAISKQYLFGPLLYTWASCGRTAWQR